MSARPGRDLLHALADPATYPHGPAAVELIQTHVSIVALAGDLVFKLKKPVRLPFLDFSSRERRRAVCLEEVRLNRRLCPDTYLGTSVLRRDGDALRFGPVVDATVVDATVVDDPIIDATVTGATIAAATAPPPDEVDYAVVMRRLPADRMLDQLLRNGEATSEQLEELARAIADFHDRADRSEQVRELGAPSNLVRLAAENFSELRAVPGQDLPRPLLDAAERASAAAFGRLLPLLERRAARGRVVDGHGDLHARNVCMTSPPIAYDCLEFSAGLRCGDVATEIAFLVMDLRYRRAAALAACFAAEYVARSRDHEIHDLLPPLVAYRAMVRSKVAAIAAAEPEIPAADRTGARASSLAHLRLAAATLIESTGPCWFVLCGPPGSGKSTLAHELHDLAAWPVVATDLVRKELAGLAPTDRALPAHYRDEFTQRTYETLLARAAASTRAGAPCVLLDGNFASVDRRGTAAAAARAAGARTIVVHVAVDRATSLARVTRRMQDPSRTSDAGPEEHASLWQRFTAPTQSEGHALVVLDGTLAGRTGATLPAAGSALDQFLARVLDPT